MKEDLVKQIIEVLKDEKVAKELETAGSQDACFKIMKGYIPELEKTEFVEAMTQLRAATSNDDSKLNEEELEKIAGGSDETYVAGVVTGVALAAAAAL